MNFSDFTSQQLEDPMRRAAVVAHALSPQDRDWLFSKLPAMEQAQLKGLLTELEQLGIPADRRLLVQALEPVQSKRMGEPALATPVSPAAPVSDLDFFIHFDPLYETALSAALRAEPALLIVRFLRIRSWPWNQRVLASLPALLRRQVDDVLSDLSEGVDAAPFGKSLEAALLRAMRLRCEQGAVVAPGKAAPSVVTQSGFSKINAWIQGWAARAGRSRP